MGRRLSVSVVGVVVASLFLSGLRPGRGPSVRFRLAEKTKSSESDKIIGKESGRRLLEVGTLAGQDLAGGTLDPMRLRTGDWSSDRRLVVLLGRWRSKG